jgi:hypothetical protein
MQTNDQNNTNANNGNEAGKPIDNVSPLTTAIHQAAELAPGVQQKIDQAATEIGAAAAEVLKTIEKPTLKERLGRISGAAGKVVKYGTIAAVAGGLGYVAYRALKGTPAAAVAEAVADAGADAATAVADAAADAVAAALR